MKNEVKAMVNGKVERVEIVERYINDFTGEEMVEVKMLDWSNVHTAVKGSDMIPEPGKMRLRINASAKLEFNKEGSEDERSLAAWITATAADQETASDLMDKIQEQMENDLLIDFHNCPDVDGNKYSDGFHVDFEHGCMKGTKEDIRFVFKRIKKELGIR